jgi:hypothetical protein
MILNVSAHQLQLVIFHGAKLLIGATSLDIPLFFCNAHRQVACEARVSFLMRALIRRNM